MPIALLVRQARAPRGADGLPSQSIPMFLAVDPAFSGLVLGGCGGHFQESIFSPSAASSSGYIWHNMSMQMFSTVAASQYFAGVVFGEQLHGWEKGCANQLMYFKMRREEAHSCVFVIYAFRAKSGLCFWPMSLTASTTNTTEPLWGLCTDPVCHTRCPLQLFAQLSSSFPPTERAAVLCWGCPAGPNCGCSVLRDTGRCGPVAERCGSPAAAVPPEHVLLATVRRGGVRVTFSSERVFGKG